MTYLKAIEAGCDIIDTACLRLLWVIAACNRGHGSDACGNEFSTGLDLRLLNELGEHFERVKEADRDHVAPLRMNPAVLTYQIPGGMLSNLRSQLAAQGMLERWGDVLEEVPRVREECGYPPLVTPMSRSWGLKLF